MTPEQRAAHVEKSRRGALVRTTPDYFIAKLADAQLTDDQRHELARVLMRDAGEVAP